MKGGYPFPFLLLIILGFISCASGHSPKKDGQTSQAETGKILPSVPCLKDPNTTYALYLPKKYLPTQKFPLILAFDPHGSGSFPLNLYSDLAEKYGYIMAGSNDSKNGNNIARTEQIIASLLQDIPGRFSVDTGRIYTMGFSGGARTASLIGLYFGGISGVIGCGAGFPVVDQRGTFRFDYIGFAGISDFNMYELLRLDQQLSQNNFNHALFLFDGIHEWPSATMMEKAFQWNKCCAMRRKIIPRDELFLEKVKISLDSLISSDKVASDEISYHRDLANTISYLKDIYETGSYKKMLSDLEQSSVYKKQQSDQQQSMENELQEQKMFTDYFFSRDLDWWKNKIAKYDSRIKAGKNLAEVKKSERLKSFLSLLAYMSYSQMLNSGNTEKADFAFQVYQIVDPGNAAKIKK